MRVVVKGHSYGGVPEQLLYEFGVYAPAKQDGGARVPEVVEAVSGSPAFFKSGLKDRLTRFSGFWVNAAKASEV